MPCGLSKHERILCDRGWSARADNRIPGKPFFIVVLTLTLLNGTCQPLPELDYTPYAFSTAAGLAGFPGTNSGPGSFARFHNPAGVAVDVSNNVYVADTFNGAIRKTTPAGTNWTVSTLASGFNYPYGVAVDISNNVYVADTLNGAIRKMTPLGTNWTVSTLASGFNYPNSVAVDTNGNVYVADSYNSIIRKVTPLGGVTTLAGQLGSPGTNDGTGTAARFNLPLGVAVDSAGNVYVADTYNETIRKVTASGVVSTLAGMPGVSGGVDGTGSVARFDFPSGVAVDSATNVYVADTDNDTIRRVTPAGVVTTLGGLLGNAGSTDAAGNGARFNNPQGVAASANGISIYVADSGNCTIRSGVLVISVPAIVPGSLAFSSNHFGFNLTGTAEQLVVVQTSTNLVNWLPIWTNTFGTGLLPFSDPQSGVSSERFYRAFTP